MRYTLGRTRNGPAEEGNFVIRKYAAVCLGLLATNVGGCATVLNGTKVDYSAVTQPDGAGIKFSNGASCTSPCKLELRRKDDLRADISLAGYKPTYVLIQSKLAGSAFGNILAGGLVGGVVDGANGASNRLFPRPLIVRLAREGSADGAVLLDEKGNVTNTVKAHNDLVRADVAKTVGPRKAGIEGDDPQ